MSFCLSKNKILKNVKNYVYTPKIKNAFTFGSFLKQEVDNVTYYTKHAH
jgi:hypothetical protein